MEGIRDDHWAPRGVYLANLALRFGLELAALCIAALWAVHVAEGWRAWALGSVLVLAFACIWGAFVAPKRMVAGTPFAIRLLVEAVLFGIAAIWVADLVGVAAGVGFALTAALSGTVAHA